MAKIHINDEAHLLRIEIEGRLAGRLVTEVQQAWQLALEEASSRKFTVDISQLTGYDQAGYKLLRDMYKHGTYVAARTPRALVFLREVSRPEVKGPALVYEADAPTVTPKRKTNTPAVRAAASGE